MAIFPTIEDRQVSFPSRVKLTKATSIKDPDVFDVKAMPGTIMKQGTPIDAALFNGIHTYVDETNNEIKNEIEHNYAKKAYVTETTLHVF